MIECPTQTLSAIMLTAENYPALLAAVVLPKHEALEVHRSKISLHQAKNGYDYPTIRLPHSFSRLAGLSTRIYQTVFDGSLAFLTVVSSTENTSKTSESSVFTRRIPEALTSAGPLFLTLLAEKEAVKPSVCVGSPSPISGGGFHSRSIHRLIPSLDIKPLSYVHLID